MDSSELEVTLGEELQSVKDCLQELLYHTYDAYSASIYAPDESDEEELARTPDRPSYLASEPERAYRVLFAKLVQVRFESFRVQCLMTKPLALALMHKQEARMVLDSLQKLSPDADSLGTQASALSIHLDSIRGLLKIE